MKVLLFPALAVAMALGACTDQGIGRRCVNTATDAAASGTQFFSPALECPSRLCLVHGCNGVNKTSVCTAFCNSDDDCASAATTGSDGGSLQCKSKFVCAVVSVTEHDENRCKKVCVCQDDLRCGFNGAPDRDAGAEKLNPIVPQGCPNASPVPACTPPAC